MTFGFIYTGENRAKVSDEIRKQLEENTWIIRPEIVAKNPDKYGEIFGKNPDKIPEKMPEYSGKNTGNSPELSQKISEKVLEKPSKLVVKKPENSTNYDVNTLEYCCKTLEKLVVSDGGSIKLTDKGLVLKSNPNYPVFRLKFCPNCGVNIEHEDDTFVQKSAPEVKEIQRDKPK